MSAELQALIDRQCEESIRPEFRDKVTNAEVCGILLAHHFKWDAVALLKVAAAALEDANYQTEAERLLVMAEGVA